MEFLIDVSWIVFTLSALAVLAVSFIYPLVLYLLFSAKEQERCFDQDYRPMVSMVVVVHNAAGLINGKIENSLSLDYPADKFELIVCSDGSTDGIEETMRLSIARGVRFIARQEHEGKNRCLNVAISQCRGEIVVFSDADAQLPVDALVHLVRWFKDDTIGGVCGQRVIAREEQGVRLSGAQKDYIRFDSTIKMLESRGGSLSSNDGKLYAVRRLLLQEIHPAVTDDLFNCLTVVSQHARFVFEPSALAFVRTPSRSPRHEVDRRRRIVARSLKGISIYRLLLNPFQYGFFSISLFVNKVMRRLLPFFLLGLLTASLVLAGHIMFFAFFLAAQLFCYGMVLAAVGLVDPESGRGKIQRLLQAAFYFCVGNYGMFLGVLDFLGGKEISKWTPKKG